MSTAYQNPPTHNIDLDIPDKLLALTKPKRFKVIIGGRGGGKSVSVAKLLAASVYAEKAKVLCTREFQSSIDDSVHSVISDTITEHDFKNFEVTTSSISHLLGGEFKFKGIARNPQSVKSLHNFKYAWCEEAQTLSDASIKLLIPTFRVKGSELWFTANPQSKADPFSKRFINPFKAQLDTHGYYEDELHLIIVINYDDNPWFPQELENDRLYDKEHLSEAEYAHIWEGQFLDEIDDAIIPAKWFDAAIDAHIKLGFKPTGIKIASHDPSDMGKDTKGYAARHGSIITTVQELEHGDVNEGCDWATGLARKFNPDVFVWDATGMGASLRRQIVSEFEGTSTEPVAFMGAESPQQPTAIYQGDYVSSVQTRKTNQDLFKNLRAQAYWRLRDRFYNTYRAVEKNEYINPDEMISISSAISCMDELRAEVCRIPRVPNGNDKIQIASKDQMKKMGISSPNMADALSMLFIDSPKKKFTPINFKSVW